MLVDTIERFLEFMGLSVWQCRHPDVNSYIKRVFGNMRPLLHQNLIEKLVLVTLINGKPRDHVSIKAQVPNPDQAPSSQDLSLIEEELRASILRLSMIEGSIPGLGEDTDFTWNIMIITKPSGNLEQEETLSKSLTNGEWMVDNNQISENVALSHRVSSSHEAETRLIPLKSYRDDFINLA
eukprot:gene32700-39534_t